MLAVSVLGLLMSESLHGYEIRKQLSALLGISGAVSYGSLYPVLAKLHSQGLIETTLEPGPAINTRTKTQQTFPTGSLTGDISLGSKLPFAKSKTISPRKRKKVYTITEKGRINFLEKLYASFVANANDDKAFAAHLAFIDFSDQEHKELFISQRIAALNERLTKIPQSENSLLQKYNSIEHEHIKQQILFLETLSALGNI